MIGLMWLRYSLVTECSEFEDWTNVAQIVTGDRM